MTVEQAATIAAVIFLTASIGTIAWVGWYVARESRPRRRRSAT